ncbi:MAG: homocysteine S-methyltransferase family protein [Candidatus Peribacteraceae bacterium]|nr:homocysteine S-methyltransferase family protein [Candidatus Peribacteraceae bacterium]MDD5743053.1 homocysteine S-methyltransferase family protein [Candidatus Peribacteraceae bacterium]
MDLRKTLDSGRVLLLDGAMGTELEKVHLRGDCFANIARQVDVAKIHLHSLAAGSEAITTNTFPLNALTPEAVRQQVDLDRANRLGVAIARTVAGDRGFVLGGMGPTGRVFGMDPAMTEANVHAAFLAQARSLTAEGVDALIIETMTSLEEALLALRACKEAKPELPVLVSMSYYTPDKGIRTLMGETAVECAQALQEKGASAVGTNCSAFTMPQMADAVGAMRRFTNIPTIAQPNAGQPHGEESTYDMTPAVFADGVGECIKRGATIVGGCCGAGPEHIRAVATKLRSGREVR